MWSHWLDRLDERFPGWAGGRSRRDLPAFAVSFGVHAAILAVLGVVGIAARAEPRAEITGAVVAPDLPALDPTEVQDVDQPDRPVVVESIGSSAPTLAALASEGSAPILAAKPDGAGSRMLLDANVGRPGDLVMPTAATLSQSVSIRGSGAEHVAGVEGAVDRIAAELLTRVEQGLTLVVWAFDASGSLVAERGRLAKQIEQVYAHINQLDTGRIAEGDALMTMVVAFGNDRKAMLAEPTRDVPAILAAIGEVPIDTTGVEATFGTVAWIAGRWGKYRGPDGGSKYQVVTIVVTDEVGDDEPQLERAIGTALAARMPVYVLGSPALFGKVEGRMNYTDPKTKKTHYNIPVRQGPESVALESILLPFWYGGDQYANLDAGFGPYALSRLAGATGGIYFVARLGPSRLTFDPDAMREYRPDWISAEQYGRGAQKDPIRGAVLQAATITQQQLPGQPGLTFPPADTPEFKEAMEREQITVARIEYTVNEALDPITAVSKLRDRETSRRWQAHYDLIRGRLLAMKIRCAEYQTACAKMKRDAPRFADAKSNAWRLVPAEQVQSGDKVDRVARETRALLERVVAEHPNTPWALLARRELKDPFGFQWVEAYVPPPPKRTEAEEVAARKKAAEKRAMPREPEIRL